MSRAVATREEVERFLAESEFTAYQSMPLPHGLRTPGRDRGPSAEYILGDVRDKTVLDIGTYLGFFPYTAARLGAARAVGVEMDPGRYSLAKRISDLHGQPYEILQGRAEEIGFDEPFDVVLFLNVIHHVIDPVEAVRNVASLSRDRVVIEFPQPTEEAMLGLLHHDREVPTRGDMLWARVRSLGLRIAGAGLPLMAVADREYHRTFYFSPEAFRNLFVTHQKIFDSVEFRPSRSHRRRMIADCRVARS